MSVESIGRGEAGFDIPFLPEEELDPGRILRAAEEIIEQATRATTGTWNGTHGESEPKNVAEIHRGCDDTEEDGSCPIPESEQEGCGDSVDNCETATDDPQDPACEE